MSKSKSNLTDPNSSSGLFKTQKEFLNSSWLNLNNELNLQHDTDFICHKHPELDKRGTKFMNPGNV